MAERYQRVCAEYLGFDRFAEHLLQRCYCYRVILM
jgi:hypothetical protein